MIRAYVHAVSKIVDVSLHFVCNFCVLAHGCSAASGAAFPSCMLVQSAVSQSTYTAGPPAGGG